MAFCIGLVGRVFQAVGSLYAALSSFSTFVSFFRDKIGGPEKNCTETSLTSSFDFLQIDDLSEGAALDLVAVLSGNELLVVGLVFAGHESFGKLKSRALGQTNIASKGTDFTGDFLHALFALNNCGVDFIDTFNNIGPGVYIIFSMTLPSHAAGKTDEARADLARLAIIRKQREEAAAKRDAEKKAKEDAAKAKADAKKLK